MKAWIKAARLRTLPLAFSCIITGTACAMLVGKFDAIILILALLTTLLFQVLSNFANDYGDAVSGKDNENRIGPDRMVAKGAISKEEMKKGMILTGILSFTSALALVIYAFQNWIFILVFLLLGLLSIWAAITYTVGKNPYGYMGLGDIFVFLFFGLVGVGACYFLYTKSFDWLVLLPSATMGLLAASVLNLNNMRDIDNDSATGKNTLVVKIGLQNAKTYHAAILIIAFLSMIAFSLAYGLKNQQYLFLLTAPYFGHILKRVLQINKPVEMDPFLKKTALATFIFSILFLIATFI
ncbi:MAG: 1,4-dihydroxy-2-naphthoate polyprenyltransferase [Chitinophagales bacterium]